LGGRSKGRRRRERRMDRSRDGGVVRRLNAGQVRWLRSLGRSGESMGVIGMHCRNGVGKPRQRGGVSRRRRRQRESRRCRSRAGVRGTGFSTGARRHLLHLGLAGQVQIGSAAASRAAAATGVGRGVAARSLPCASVGAGQVLRIAIGVVVRRCAQELLGVRGAITQPSNRLWIGFILADRLLLFCIFLSERIMRRSDEGAVFGAPIR
jgi:hypothetical protein